MYNKKVFLYVKFLITLFWILSFFVVINGFQKNTARDGEYELVYMNGREYNFNLLNNISEREYLELGFNIWFLLQVTSSQIKSFHDKLLEYEAYKIDLPSQIWNALINKKEEKYISYVPKKYDKKKAIFVIHGNSWGFLFYQKFLNTLATKNNIAVIEPVFWWWNWDEDWGTELIFDTHQDLMNKNIIDNNTQIVLVWLSNWGKWLSRAILHDVKNIFQKVIYISAIVEKDIYTLPLFKEHYSQKEVYFLHGAKDDRVFLSDVLDFIVFHDIKHIIYPEEDHFLFIHKDKQILEFIEKVSRGPVF